jgi:hypothetical protein
MMFRMFEARRGGPIDMIRRGDLAQPYVRTLWQRTRATLKSIAEVMRESREMERRMLGERGYHGLGDC